MFRVLELYTELIELRRLGLTEEEVEGYFDFFTETLRWPIAEIV
jgi:hypothetical protein